MSDVDALKILLFLVGFLAGMAFERLKDFDKDGDDEAL